MITEDAEYTQQKILQMMYQYDPERDLIPNAPKVTSSEYHLLMLIQSLLGMIKNLQVQINDLRG